MTQPPPESNRNCAFF